MADAPIVKDRPKCEAPGCGMPAVGSTSGINHCDNHLGWVQSGDAEKDIARLRGEPQAPEVATGYTCRCGGAWDVEGKKTIGDAFFLDVASLSEESRARLAKAGGNPDTPLGHLLAGHHVFQRIGRGSLRDFLS